MKKVGFAMIITTIATIMLLTPTNVFALTSDFDYNFITENKDEFYNVGESNLNFNGEMPDYLHDIYDITPQTVNTSHFGSTIITPNEQSQTPVTNAPYYAPVGSYQAAPTQTTGGTEGTNAADYMSQQNNQTNTSSNNNPTSNNPNMTGSLPSFEDEEKLAYPLTSIEKVRNSNGSIGTLKIPTIGLTVTAYDGDTFTAMKKGVGHIASTSAWNGVVGLVGHNRGTNNYFGKLKNLSVGDEMTYQTKLGTRTFAVEKVIRIAETDWSYLEYSNDNRLVLITCVENVPSQRLCVVATEKR